MDSNELRTTIPSMCGCVKYARLGTRLVIRESLSRFASRCRINGGAALREALQIAIKPRLVGREPTA